ncbi:neurofilament heavy polypeptide-like [Pyrus ussuriensis x Pyrus communis]|uniref:Neurofilament heavy polypeptide-like n=1 Tax=Pyrus ussuriensis x Pyrus communis TaxID=2448454 RepID=A0A5N5GTU0_9ROSA|nr:neurofilament heavy polypeptide-like [Pyrus ussuriensis x Pyrus communis]
MLLALCNQPFQSIEFWERRKFSGKMSDSGEQGATMSGQVSDSDEQTAPSSDEQTAPSSAQLPDSSGEEAQDSGEAVPNSEESSDPSEAAEDSEENTESREPVPPTPANTPASSVGETAGEKNFDFEDVRAALAETIPGFVGQQAQVNPLRINFNASGSGEASVAEAPKLMPNPPSWIEDSDEERYQGQREAANPNEQETDSSDSGEPEVQSAAPPEVIIMTPADWKKALSDQAKAEEEEEEKDNPKEVVPELIHNTNLQQAEIKERAVAHPSLIGGSSMNPDPPAAVREPDSQPSENAAENVELGKRKIDAKGKGKLEENQEDGGEEEEAASPRSKIPKKSQDERLAIGDPSLQARSNKNPVLPPATPVTKPDLKPSESATEGKRKIGEKGKGSKGEERSEEDEAASPNSKKLKGPEE